MSATIKLENKHFPVLLNELISIISPLYGGTFLDCTFGQGGYSRKILENKNNKIIAIDRDQEVYSYAKELKKKYNNRFQFENIKFSEISSVKVKSKDLKAIIFDLGYSINQIKDLKRGLSFKSTGKLNMKMGLNNFSCHEVIYKMSENNLYKIFKYYGDERFSKKIARKIIQTRKLKIINTEELSKIVDSVKRYKNSKINNSTKVFQALRILVNKEISELIYGLINAAKVLKKDGVLAVVTFHSLEDKIVKYFFKSLSEKKSISRYMPNINQPETLFSMVEKKPITPSAKELRENTPSRSAKLRYVIKKNDFYNFETDIVKKFKTLLDIENFGEKL